MIFLILLCLILLAANYIHRISSSEFELKFKSAFRKKLCCPVSVVLFDVFRITFCILWYIEAIYKYKAIDKVIDKLKAINRYSFIYVGFRFATLSFLYSLIECIYLILERRSYSLRKNCPYSELFWSAFSLHFYAFGLSTEGYFASLHIQSECGKMQEKCGPE